jgi:dienelactone hydrolase
MTMRGKYLLSLLVFACVAAYAQEKLATDINESVFKLPVSVKDMYGKVVTRDMAVTQYKPDGDGPFPIAVLLHGRSATDRSLPARQRYSQAARYFVRRGFAVWVPTRIGYGESGLDPDPEYSGTCDRKSYPPGYEAAATAALNVITYAKAQPFADPARIVILGQSYGGATSIALAAKNPPGVLGTINFAGGGGGDPVNKTYEPCRPDLLRHMFGTYGKTARIPTLWVYTENDKYFGPSYPKTWHAEFARNGGTGEFKAMPAFGDDGHALFGHGFPLWRPLVDNFLTRLGFAIPRTEGAPPASAYAALEASDKLPLVSAEGREKYLRFLQLDIPRAYAIGPKGAFAYSSAPDGMARALNICKKHAKTDCKLYAVDDRIVWKE